MQLSAIALLFIGMISCDSDPLVDIPSDLPTTTFQSVDNLLEDMEPDVETFSLSAENGGTFTTQRGSEITIQPNSFVDGNGQAVTGNVDIEFQEIFTPSDAITSGAYTISNGTPIGTGGAFFIGAEQNGQRVDLNRNRPAFIEIPSQQSNSAMQLFTGGTSISSAPAWVPLDTAQFWAWLDLVDTNFRVTLNQFMWVNCDYFVNTTWENPVHFDLVGRSGLDLNNSRLFVHEPSSLATYPLMTTPSFSFSNSAVRNARCNSVPQVVVALAIHNGTIYLGHTTITPTAGTTYPIQMNAVTQADLQAFLASL